MPATSIKYIGSVLAHFLLFPSAIHSSHLARPFHRRRSLLVIVVHLTGSPGQPPSPLRPPCLLARHPRASAAAGRPAGGCPCAPCVVGLFLCPGISLISFDPLIPAPLASSALLVRRCSAKDSLDLVCGHLTLVPSYPGWLPSPEALDAADLCWFPSTIMQLIPGVSLHRRCFPYSSFGSVILVWWESLLLALFLAGFELPSVSFLGGFRGLSCDVTVLAPPFGSRGC